MQKRNLKNSGKEVFGVDTAEAAVEALADFIKECGLPTKMGELKSKDRDHTGSIKKGSGHLQHH